MAPTKPTVSRNGKKSALVIGKETTQHGGVYQEPEQSSTNPLLIKQSPG